MTHTTRRGWLVAAGVMLAAIVAPASARATDVNEVLARMRQAVAPGKDMRATLVFVISNAKGESVRWTGHLYRRSGEQPRMRLTFDDPLDLRGTEVEVRGRDGAAQTRIYLPSIRRVRELTADMRGESFLGTDFNYEDLGLQQLDYQQHTLDGSGCEVDGHDGYRIESMPDRGWWYGKIVRCIDRKDYLPRRTEYYDRGGVVWKVRTLDGVKKIGGYPTATAITMRTVPAGTATRVELSDVQYDTGLSDVLFEGQ